ncbi:ketopantoate reductase PanE/ApbA C terminal-domain-containing protein [Elsinoe ampelina]|uniref:2-dehydropantoate 2-reductase n=1 Tax=Elsinoe ampelina TaxID=302913 RepID=A0A6A6G095_9PEZI|nr:ketopantoate reductase PanE/ApbA C terminal-domain-containing protein [Elsinoe ampelina]
MAERKPKVLLFGSGAIGTIYVYILQQAGCDVSAVCRSNYEAAKANGFHITSAIFGTIHLQCPIYPDLTTACPPGTVYDYLIITTKTFLSPVPLPSPSPAAALIAPAITPSHTTLVLIQNGLLIEEEYAAAYPENPLLSCVVYLPSTQTAPGVIEMGELELLEIGTYPAAAPEGWKARAEAFGALIRRGGGTAEVYDDVQVQRWKKLVLNCGWNPVCALSRSRDVAVLQACGEAEGYVRGVMMEVVKVAGRCGYGMIDGGTVEGVLRRAKERLGTRGIEPSMLADVRGGRRMEVEAILGGVVRLGREKGVEVPRLEGLYVLMKALDSRVEDGSLYA